MFVPVNSKNPQTVEDLGGKGFGLWYMSNLGVQVPPALVIPTSMCVEYMQKPKTVMKEIAKNLWRVTEYFNEQLGYMPLVSVRSGARVSMPGMMDTILNVGLDNQSIPNWKEKLGEKCVFDSYERLIEMYGSVVCGIERRKFEGLNATKRLQLFQQESTKAFPDAKEQMLGAIEAVFKSWNNERAKVYRKMHGISDKWGTAVVIQAMVFGNLNDKSGTGVLFTRNPDNGEDKVVGEFLINAQGEDVVAGIRTPMPLQSMPEWNKAVFEELMVTVLKLEADRKDVQDVEFTVQDGKLFILQTRNAKRSAQAAVRIACSMLKQGSIDESTFFSRVTKQQYLTCKSPMIDAAFKEAPVATGIPACSGVATGVIVHSAKAAIDCKEPCVMVTQETTPEDIAGMIAAKGVLTMTGGSTSHAAVVARGMDKPCVVGLGASLSDYPEGTMVSIDGATGRVWKTVVPVIDGSNSEWLAEFEATVAKLKGVRIISSNPMDEADMYDLLDMMLHGEAGAIVFAKNLKEMKPGKMLDMLTVEGSPEHDFLSIFGDPEAMKKEFLTNVAESAPGELNKHGLVGFVHPGMQCAPMVASLEDLILAEGKYVPFNLDMSNPVVKKVLDWRQSVGCEPMVIGSYVGEGSYLFRSQMDELLNG